MLPLQLHAQHHDDVGILNGVADIGGQAHAGRELRQFHRQQRRRSAEHDLRAELGEQVHVGARHAAVRDVADDRHPQAFQVPAAIQNGARVQQRLGGMLVRAVAGVDDRRGQVARQKMRRAGGRVAHHDGVRPHRAQRVQRVHQRFALAARWSPTP